MLWMLFEQSHDMETAIIFKIIVPHIPDILLETDTSNMLQQDTGVRPSWSR